MKFTKLFMAAFAAMAIASCSKEAETFNPDASVAPGDARISFAMGKTTTYATAAEETHIDRMQVYAFFTDEQGAAVSADLSGSWADGKLDHTFVEGSYKPGAEATLFFLANTAHTFNNVWTAQDVKDLKIGRSIYTIVDGKIVLNPLGMISFLEKKVPLEAGASVVEKLSLPRVTARLYAEGFESADITGYKVSYANVASNVLLTGMPVTPAVTGAAPEYTITGNTEDQYNSKEAVGYFYPTVGNMSVIVTSPIVGVAPKTVAFKPEANTNYKLNIKVSGQGSNVNFTAEILKWTEGKDVDVDFSEPAAPIELKAGFTGTNVVLKDGALEVTSMATNNFSINLKDLVTVSGMGNDYQLTADSELLTRAAVTGISDVNTVDGVLTVDHFTIYHKDGLKFKLSVNANDTNGDVIATLLVPITIKPIAVIPDGFLLDMGTAGTFAAVNTRGGVLSADIEFFNKVNATSGTVFSDKVITYLKGNVAQFAEVVGPKLTNHAAALLEGACPKGFKVPAKSDFKALLANTFNFAGNAFTTTNPVQYNVAARGTLESITDGNRSVVSSDYKVGVFNSDLQTGDAANKAYRVFQYQNTSMVVVVAGITSSPLFGGLYTTDGNVGFGGSAGSVTMYTEASGAGSLELRCIKDVAADVIW